MNFRKLLFWTHLVAGVVTGIVILVMSVTGVLLTYERQMIAWADRGSLRVPVPATPRMPVAALVESARSQRPELPPSATMTLRSGRSEPVEISLGREGAIYQDPYTGRILGVSNSRVRQVFSDIRVWHRWLGTAGNSPSRSTAKAITGASNLAFLFIVCSGLYLWLPKVWNRRSLAAISWFRTGLSGKARDFNWHNVIGLWTAVPLFIVVITAVPFSYKWGNDLVFRLAGSPVPSPGPGPRQDRPQGQPVIDLASAELLLARAQSQVPDWRSITFRIADRPGAPLSLTIDSGDGGQPQKRYTLVLDRTTAETVKWETFDSLDAGRRLRSWTRFLHTGEALGIPGQTLAGLASLAGCFLVWTGVSLSLRRFAAWRARQARETEPADPIVA